MIITVGGDIGSGKSTVAKLLAERLQYKSYSMGTIFRKMADEQGMTVEEFADHAKKNPDVNKQGDNYQRKLGQSEDDFVIEGRLSWRFIPNSFKVFLHVDSRIAAQRIFSDHLGGKRKTEKTLKDVDDALAEITIRQKTLSSQYKEQYGIDYLDTKNYDLVINTSNILPGQIVDDILAAIKKKA